jgi:hypothetical protein
LTASGVCASATDQVTITFDPAATANAGTNQSICSGSTAQLSGNVGGSATMGTWSTSGDGSFSPNATSLNAQYVPGPNDILAGTVTLTLTTDNPPGACNAVTSQLTLTILTEDATFTYGGGTFCNTGSNPTPTVISGATGTFSGGVVFVSTSTGQIDVAATPLGTYTVIFTTDGPCPDIYQVTVTITDTPDASFSYSGPFCQNGGSILPAFPVGASAGVFTVSPTTGLTIVNPTSGEIDLAGAIPGTYTITNTIVASGGCAQVVETFTIEILEADFADAGTDINICQGTTTVTLNGTVSGSNTIGTWSTLGDGTFANANDPQTVYNVGPQDEVAGTVTLILSTTNTSGCAATSDTIVITIQEIPVLDAGLDQTLCANNAEVQLLGTITGGNGTAIWTVTGGDGSFNDDTDMNAVYSPGPGDIASGGFYIVLSATNSCIPVSDSIFVDLTQAPTVNAGNNITICNNEEIMLNGTYTIAGGAVWSSNGSGTFTPDETSQSVEYLPSAGDISAGSVTIYYTTTDNGDCLAETDGGFWKCPRS